MMNCHDQFNNAKNVDDLANGIATNTTGILKNLFTPECVSMEYLPVLIFLVIALGLSIVVILIPFIVNKLRPDQEKNSPYECGFEGQGVVRNKFSVQFYLVAILFIIFDLEIAFLFPWAVVLKQIGVFGYVSMMIFLGLLTIGFIYEWKRGALEWK